MKILIIDRDELTVNMLRAKLEPMGHDINVQPDKNKAMDGLPEENYDLVFIDPAPLTAARPLVMNIRRAARQYTYIMITSETFSQADGLKAGANNLLPKPLDGDGLKDKVKNANRLIDLVKRIGDTSEDFMSAGGVIAKSAFNQLFLSGIDRADRYGEQTFLLFISLSNYDDIYKMAGAYAADLAVAKLCKHLVKIRRQSDIIGQTAKYEYALLLQRPVYETEPLEAAKRFAVSLSELKPVAGEIRTPVELKVSLIGIPVGAVMAEHTLTHQPPEEKDDT